MAVGCDDQIGFFRQINGNQHVAHAFRPGRGSLHEDRNVGTERNAKPAQLFCFQCGVPEPVQSNQGSGGVGAAAPQPRAGRNSLVQVNDGTGGCAGRALQGTGRLSTRLSGPASAGSLQCSTISPVSLLSKCRSSPWSSNWNTVCNS